jgi:drug/metabolite transporter (DMT)-like permease
MQRSFSTAAAGALAMVGCAFLWSTAGLFIKLLDWNPYWIAGLRSLIAGIFLLAYSGFSRGSWRIRWSWPLVGAAVANAVCMMLFVLANKLTTSANAILIQYWAPVATAVLSVLVLKERLHLEQIVALVVTLGGLVLLFADKLGAGVLWGNLAALGSGLAFSLVFLFTRMQKDADPLQSLMLSHFLLALVALAVAGFQPLPAFTVESVSSIVFLGLAQVGVAAVLFTYAIRRISALTANLLSVIEPVLNPLWVLLVLGEIPSMRTVAGGVLIVASVTVASLVGARRHQASPSTVPGV